MYRRSSLKSRLRALLLVGLLAFTPVAGAINRDGGTTLSEWVWQLLSTIWVNASAMEDGEEECPPEQDCRGLHVPGG